MAGKDWKMKQKVVYYYDESDDDFSEIAIEKLNVNSFRPKKKLLILGLGGLLCHRVWRKSWFDVPKHCSPDASFGSIFDDEFKFYKQPRSGRMFCEPVYKRPYCEEFIEFCMERFDIAIWSSAKEWYLNNALDCLMGIYKQDLLFAWDQNECTYSGFDTLEKRGKPLFLKELKKVWEREWRNNGNYSASIW